MRPRCSPFRKRAARLSTPADGYALSVPSCSSRACCAARQASNRSTCREAAGGHVLGCVHARAALGLPLKRREAQLGNLNNTQSTVIPMLVCTPAQRTCVWQRGGMLGGPDCLKCVTELFRLQQASSASTACGAVAAASERAPWWLLRSPVWLRHVLLSATMRGYLHWGISGRRRTCTARTGRAGVRGGGFAWQAEKAASLARAPHAPGIRLREPLADDRLPRVLPLAVLDCLQQLATRVPRLHFGTGFGNGVQ